MNYEKKGISVIINADDLGKSHDVNIAINNALNSGVITSSTILANSNCLDEVKQIVTEHPDASFGVHLNLTEGKALTNHNSFLKYNMVDQNGSFIKENSKKNWHLNKEQESIIFEEWDAQVRLLKSYGIDISHIDGHHHAHSWFGLEKVLLKVMRIHNITKNRNRFLLPIKKGFVYVPSFNLKNKILKASFEKSKQKMAPKSNNILLRVQKKIKSLTNEIKWQLYMSLGSSKMTNYFDSYEGLCNYLKSGQNLPDGCTLELMCHPSHPDYEKEMNLIYKNEIKQLVKVPVKFISYKEL